MTDPFTPAFCSSCGNALTWKYVVVEERERHVCTECGRIHYLNPSPVAGVIPVVDGRVWLLRRAIAPRLGSWTYPAGFMELGESAEDAAIRETKEELNLDVRLVKLLNVYSRAGMASVVIVYLADALSEPSAGIETLDFASFAPGDIPWPDLAFWSTKAALTDWVNSLL